MVNICQKLQKDKKTNGPLCFPILTKSSMSIGSSPRPGLFFTNSMKQKQQMYISISPNQWMKSEKKNSLPETRGKWVQYRFVRF